MLTVLDDPAAKSLPIVLEEEEEEGGEGWLGEEVPALPQPLPEPESPYWSADGGTEEEE